MRRILVSVPFSLLLLAGVALAPAAAATTVSGGSLKLEGLSDLAKGGKMSLVGFAWNGPVRPFGDAFPADGLTAETGDRSFAVASDGPVTLCQGLGKLGSRTFDEGRLSFKGTDGPLAALKVGGVTVASVDCAKSPWTAEFRATTLEPAAERAEGKAKDKAKDKTKSKAKKAGKGKAQRG